MATAEFKDKLTEGLEGDSRKAKKPEIENVLEWISRLVAAKDVEGVVALVKAAGTDQKKVEEAVTHVKDLFKDKRAGEITALELLLDDIPSNKDAITTKVKELVTGNKNDVGITIDGVPTELSESYKSLVVWLQDGGTDQGRRELEVGKIRKLDNEALDHLEAQLTLAAGISKKIDKNKVQTTISEINKQKVERREVLRILNDDDAEKINKQARKLMDKLKTKTQKSIGSKAESVADQRHLLEALKLMGQIKAESASENISWDEYIKNSDKLTSDKKQLLIAGMEVIKREAGENLKDYEEIYVFMKQVRDSWNDHSLAEAYEQRQKHLTEKYGRQPTPGGAEERFMPERMTERMIRNNPELLQRWMMGDEVSDLFMDPNSDLRGYAQGRMGLNIDYEMLRNEDDDLMKALSKAGLEGIIDLETMSTKGVPSLKLEGFTAEQRKQAENIILQELLKQVRMLVSESVEGNTMMYDPRATRYFTLLTISGVSPDLKQTVGAHMKLHYLEFMWRNGYVDEEVYGRLLKFYSEQGPEYRLHEALKIREQFVLKGKEGKDIEIGEFNQYDFEKYLTRNVSDSDKAHFGMPAHVNRTNATVLATKVTPDGMAADRKVFLRSMLKEHWGDRRYTQTVAKFDSETDFLDKFMGKEGKYTDYIHKSYIYWIGNGRLGEVVGNGNLKTNKGFELVQGVPEYYYKRDPRLMVMFLWMYKPQLVPDVLAPMMRMGITSLASMYGEEIAGHFISMKDSNQGAPGINSTFLKGASSQHGEAWRMMWEDSLYDYDEYHEVHGHAKESIYFEKASKKKPKDGHDALAARRTNGDTIKRLKRYIEKYSSDPRYGESFFNAINWSWAIEKYEHNKELVALLKSRKTGKEKLDYFVNHFGDDYFVTEGLKAKRGDAWMKYMGKYQDEFFKAAVEYATNPEVETMAKLTAIVNNIVGSTKIGPFRERMREVLYYMSKSRMVGEKYDLFDIDNEGKVIFDDERWVGSNQGEFPMPKIISKRNIPTMNMKKNSVLAYRGLEGKVYEPLLERVLLRDMRAANAFPDIKEYNKKVWQWRFGLLWERDRGTALNIISLLTGRSLSEFIAVGLFEMPPHKFWEWFFENTEKSWETTLKVFGGGGHH